MAFLHEIDTLFQLHINEYFGELFWNKAIYHDSSLNRRRMNSALHWIKGPEPVLKGFWRSLRTGGTLLAQFGRRKNAAEILKIIDSMLEDKKWSCYFRDFVFSYGFYGPEEYREWLKKTGFIVKRLEMNSKDMALVGKESLPQ